MFISLEVSPLTCTSDMPSTLPRLSVFRPSIVHYSVSNSPQYDLRDLL